MPEIRNTFIGGKMNKDLDERLIPEGQYRDAMNVQVSTSDGSNVGTLQNILGNTYIDNQIFDWDVQSTNPTGAFCVGSIADEKDDALYWLIYSPNKDVIMRFKDSIVTPVFVDVRKDVLKFDPDVFITGINIIDDLLFWTDGVNEPRKININNCIEGTDSNGKLHTKLINVSQNIHHLTNIDILEEHITVIKKAPKNPPTLQYTHVRDPNLSHCGIMQISDGIEPSSFISSSVGVINNFNYIGVGDKFRTVIERNLSYQDEFVLDWKNGDAVVLKEFSTSGSAPIIPFTVYTIKGFITDWDQNTFSSTFPNMVSNSDFNSGNLTDPDDWWNSNTSWASLAPWKWNGSNLESIGVSGTWVGTNLNPNNPAGHHISGGGIYEISFDIGDPNSGLTSLEGRVEVVLSDEDGHYYTVLDTDTVELGVGKHVETITHPGLAAIQQGGTDWSTVSTNPFLSTMSTQQNTNSIVFVTMLDTSGNAFNGTIDNVSIRRMNYQQAKVEIEITSINGVPQGVYDNQNILNYAIDKFIDEDKLFVLSAAESPSK